MCLCGQRGWRRGAVVVVVLCAYLVAALGVLPSPAVVGRWLGRVSGTSERFPCEDHGCGCGSATECWSHCCCFTEVERLSWALERGITPPESVQISEESWVLAARRLQPGDEHCAACVPAMKERLRRGVGIRPVHVARTDQECAAGCDQSSPGAKSCHRTGSRDREAGRDSAKFVSGAVFSALSCKGVKELLAVGLPPARLAGGVWTLLPSSTSPEIVQARDEVGDSRTLDATEPPPRSGTSALC